MNELGEVAYEDMVPVGRCKIGSYFDVDMPALAEEAKGGRGRDS